MQHKELLLTIGLLFLASCSYRTDTRTVGARGTQASQMDTGKEFVMQKDAAGESFFDIENYKFTSLLPVNHATAKVTMSINIPQNFKSIYSFEQSTKTGFQEYIPKSDVVSNWSEMITTKSYILAKTGFSVSAVKVADQIRQGILQQGGPNVEELLHATKEHKGYTTSKFMYAYNDPFLNGGRAVMYAEYASGTYDCAGVQYAIALSDTMTKKDAVKKINAFAKNNITIINA